jgi:hypothetical protein
MTTLTASQARATICRLIDQAAGSQRAIHGALTQLSVLAMCESIDWRAERRHPQPASPEVSKEIEISMHMRTDMHRKSHFLYTLNHRKLRPCPRSPRSNN